MLKNYYALSIMQMKNLIKKTIKEKTRAAGPFPGYREPLVGYALALTVDGLDKPACYRRLLEVDARYDDLGLCDVCGKCATGPCAVMPGDL